MKPVSPVLPVKWPQDKLLIPDGQNGMPRVDPANALLTEREAFTYSGTYTQGGVNAGGWVGITIPITPDADFWCTKIIARGTGGDFNEPIRVIDIRTGYNLTYPYSRVFFFEPNGGFTGDPPVTNDALMGGEIPQPYCFTRNGGIRVEIDRPLANRSYEFAFSGWKDYANVSR